MRHLSFYSTLMTAPDLSSAPWENSKRRWRVIHGIKAGLAVLCASTLTLSEDVHRVTDTGPWAVITVVILMQQTVGATVQKAANRCIGTILAAAAAVLTGVLCRTIPHQVGGVILLQLCMFTVTYRCTQLSGSTRWADWKYAIFLCCMTYNFLALLAFRENLASSIFRMLMVAAGAVIAVCCSMLPPQQRATTQLRLSACTILCPLPQSLLPLFPIPFPAHPLSP